MTGDRPVDLTGLSPAEPVPGEDPLQRFLHEARRVQTVTRVVAPADLAAAVLEALAAAPEGAVALTADLGEAREALLGAVAATGRPAHRYEDIAGDRAAVRALAATVTGCLAAVAATGSVVTGGAAGRAGALVAPLHVAVVPRERILGGLRDLLGALPGLGGGSAVALQSGPSRTADIEKTLILGMHGPKAVHVLVVDAG